ncbi:mannose-1-phosphate guanylyltransferase [Parenemella sanctibonifatiensis]|uniref:Mannose-1-phosphate guanylyltransferase n=1 Tax=Parenemella sanctibonifatiensis TaxID=2016505 RepID=A0A255E8I6_9ACTN|nr:mannose-1-phosphate guanylyltransferase [Parenemella sanctibonifatiensis]OYN87869.1 mannose-1-phosphate guanylyltransferase [Parenemella sanctibonifatiensis]
MRYVVIMAGGSGKRLWPLSRRDTPKQLLRLFEDKSLMRLAYERVQGLVPDDQIYVCIGADYADVVAEELPELPAANLLGEPEGRDTLNAVAWPTAVIHRRDPDATIAVLTADQLIEPVDAFRDALGRGFDAAESDEQALVTFGVLPTRAHTGYGYLHRGEPVGADEAVVRVKEFREKPDLATAEEYLASGEFWWNAGMFVWRAATLLHQVEQLQPDVAAGVREIAEHPERLEAVYPGLTKISIDYAVMEPASRGRTDAHVVAVRLPISWHDVGGYATLLEQLPADANGNVSEGITTLTGAHGSLAINRQDGHLVALVGVNDLAVVHTDEVTMVVPVSDAERVKELLTDVAEQHGDAYL